MITKYMFKREECKEDYYLLKENPQKDEKIQNAHYAYPGLCQTEKLWNECQSILE